MKLHAIRAATLLLLAVSPAAGQRTAAGQATLHVGEVLTLRVEPGGGVAALTADGTHRDLPGAVRLQVIANRSWQLSAVAAGGGEDADRPVWYRVGEISGPAEGDVAYREAGPTPAVVTRGEAGRSVMEVDYRWLEEAGESAEADVVLHFTLSPG